MSLEVVGFRQFPSPLVAALYSLLLELQRKAAASGRRRFKLTNKAAAAALNASVSGVKKALRWLRARLLIGRCGDARKCGVDTRQVASWTWIVQRRTGFLFKKTRSLKAAVAHGWQRFALGGRLLECPPVSSLKKTIRKAPANPEGLAGVSLSKREMQLMKERCDDGALSEIEWCGGVQAVGGPGRLAAGNVDRRRMAGGPKAVETNAAAGPCRSGPEYGSAVGRGGNTEEKLGVHSVGEVVRRSRRREVGNAARQSDPVELGGEFAPVGGTPSGEKAADMTSREERVKAILDRHGFGADARSEPVFRADADTVGGVGGLDKFAKWRTSQEKPARSVSELLAISEAQNKAARSRE